jgi:hypothetical protein
MVCPIIAVIYFMSGSTESDMIEEKELFDGRSESIIKDKHPEEA